MATTTQMHELFRRHVVVALDVDTLDQAIDLSTRLLGHADKFKIGSRLFTKYGPEILDRLGDLGVQVFLDLKFHDIPSVVGDACKNAADHPAVFLMTVHAAGGRAMLEAAVRGIKASTTGSAAKVVAVTALTSLAPADLPAIGIEQPLEAWINQLADTALGAGIDGLVCSSQEAIGLRQRFGPTPLLVTPGIRMPIGTIHNSGHEPEDDQARVLTPIEALQAGSDLLVIGRPIYQSADPVAVVDRIARSLTLSN